MAKAVWFEGGMNDGFRHELDDAILLLIGMSTYCGMDPLAWLTVNVRDDDCGTLCLYRTQEAKDADPDRTHPDAWIHRYSKRRE